MTRIVFIFLTLVFSFHVYAQEGLHNESEGNAMVVSGNANNETYGYRQKTWYEWDLNIITAWGRYILARQSGVESAKAWELGLRYDRKLNDWSSVFAAHSAESDIFAGYYQRDNTDIGYQYRWIHTDETKLLSEIGYRYIYTRYTNRSHEVNNTARLYSEVKHTINEMVTSQLWVEYIPSFTEAENYYINAEPSLSVMLSRIFSLKTAYLFKYTNKIPPAQTERLERTFTTSLVAKF